MSFCKVAFITNADRFRGTRTVQFSEPLNSGAIFMDPGAKIDTNGIEAVKSARRGTHKEERRAERIERENRLLCTFIMESTPEMERPRCRKKPQKI